MAAQGGSHHQRYIELKECTDGSGKSTCCAHPAWLQSQMLAEMINWGVVVSHRQALAQGHHQQALIQMHGSSFGQHLSAAGQAEAVWAVLLGAQRAGEKCAWPHGGWWGRQKGLLPDLQALASAWPMLQLLLQLLAPCKISTRMVTTSRPACPPGAPMLYASADLRISNNLSFKMWAKQSCIGASTVRPNSS